MTFRSFISVDIEATEDIRAFIKSIGETGAGLNIVSPEKIHITVKFLGDIEEGLKGEISDKLRNIVGSYQPFRIELKDVGAFPKMDYMKVIWIGVQRNAELSDIAHRVEEELVPLGFTREKRSFSPHLTVARVKGGRSKQRLKAVLDDYANHDFGTQKVTKLRLKKSVLKSQGSEYTTLEEFYLG